MANGFLLGAFDFSTARADEFHDWYDLEHLPERQRVPGFSACERWIGIDAPTAAVAIYDLDSIEVLGSAAYKAIAYENLSPWSKRMVGKAKLLLRFEGVQILPGREGAPQNAGAMFLDAMNVVPEAERAFNGWVDNAHIPAVKAVDGVLAARRFTSEQEGAGLRRHVAIYHLADPDVLRSPAWKAVFDDASEAGMRPHIRDRLQIPTRRYVRQT